METPRIRDKDLAVQSLRLAFEDGSKAKEWNNIRIIGEFFEEVVCGIVDGDRCEHTTKSRCPDLIVDANKIVEVKSFCRFWHAEINLGQFHYYENAARHHGYECYYVFAVHSIKESGKVKTVSGLIERLQDETPDFYCLPWHALSGLMDGKTISQYGKQKIYALRTRISLNDIKKAGIYSIETAQTNEFRVRPLWHELDCEKPLLHGV